MFLKKAQIIGALGLIAQLSACGLRQQAALLLSDGVTAGLHVNVYRVTDSNDRIGVVALMGPFLEAETKVYKAFDMLGCESPNEAYQVLGINPLTDSDKLISDEEKLEAGLEGWDTNFPDRPTFEQNFGLGKRSISCKSSGLASLPWYWDVGSDYYFPNIESTTGEYFRIPESCDPLARTLESQFDPNTKELSFGIPEGLEGKIQDLVCGTHVTLPVQSSWGWSLSYVRSVNFNNFQYAANEPAANSSILLLSYKTPGNDRIDFPILGINGQKFPSSSVRKFTDEMKVRLNQFIAKVAPVLPPVTTLPELTMSNAEQIYFASIFESTPLYELCLEGAPLDCQAKAYWAKNTTPAPEPDADPTPVKRFLLTPAKLKLTEKSLINNKISGVITVQKSNPAENVRIASEPCGAYDVLAAFAGNIQSLKSLETATLDELKKESISYQSSFRPVLANQTVSCNYPSSQVCKVTVNDELGLSQAFAMTQCPENSAILDVTIGSDLNLTRPFELAIDPSNSKNRINKLAEIVMRGSAIKDGETMRWPLVTKTYGNPSFRSLFKFSGIPSVSLQNLTLTSRAASLDQTALSLNNVKVSLLDNVQIRSTAPSTAFTLGISASNTRLGLNKISIDAGNIGLQALSSRIVWRSRDNSIIVSRPSETKALELNRSLLAADGLNLSGDYSASLNKNSVLFAQVLKLKGIDNTSSLGFLFQSGASYAFVSEKAEFQDLYTDVWVSDDAVSTINNQNVKSEVKVGTTLCTNVQYPSEKICKKL